MAGSLAGKFPGGSETRLCSACREKIASLNGAGQKEVAAELWREISKAGKCRHIDNETDDWLMTPEKIRKLRFDLAKARAKHELLLTRARIKARIE